MLSSLVLLVLSTATPAYVPRKHVLPVFGYGTGCRMQTENLSLLQRMSDGRWRIKVRQPRWVQNSDWKSTQVTCVDQPASVRAALPVQVLWLLTDCGRERFATSKNPDRSDVWEQDVFNRDGASAGEPNSQTVAGNPFMRWAKLCSAEAEEGNQKIRVGFQH